MELKIKAKKIEMTQIYDEQSHAIPVTILKVDEDKDLDQLKVGQSVKISGVSKGKGFAGAVKRWGFHGGPKTHGQSDRHRAVGSIGGGTDPGKVWKGKKMPGHMGQQRVTTRNLKIAGIDEKSKIVQIKGAVPGHRHSRLTISPIRQTHES